MMIIQAEYYRNKPIKDIPKRVPMALFKPELAIKNHSQTLERLNERGGIGVNEALDLINGTDCRWKETTQAHIDYLNNIVYNYNNQNNETL